METKSLLECRHGAGNIVSAPLPHHPAHMAALLKFASAMVASIVRTVKLQAITETDDMTCE